MSGGATVRVLGAALVVVLAGACADWVGDDVRSGEAAVVERPDEVVTPTAATATTVPPDPVDPRSLPDGSCADDVPADDGDEAPPTVDGLLSGAAVVPRHCDEEHRYELFATVLLGTPETAWPGPDQVREDALRACTAELEAFVGVEWSDSTLDQVALTPDEAAWAAGERGARCVLFDLGLEPLDATARGSGL